MEQTIQSVISQDVRGKEILLVDGGSTDGSLEIIRKYADHFAWWVSEPDAGQGDGINKGLRRAQADVVGWLNSDDTYQPGTLQKVLTAWRTNSDAVLIYGDVLAVDELGKPIQVIPCGSYTLQDLCKFRIINQPAVFMKRTILEQVGYLNLDYQYLLDHVLWLKMGLHGKIIRVPEVWSCGRFHPSAKNVANADEFGEEAHRISRWLLNDPAYREVIKGIENNILAGADRMDARYHLDAGNYRSAFVSYIRGMRTNLSMILPEWHRVIFSLMGMCGLGFLRSTYLSLRKAVRGNRIG